MPPLPEDMRFRPTQDSQTGKITLNCPCEYQFWRKSLLVDMFGFPRYTVFSGKQEGSYPVDLSRGVHTIIVYTDIIEYSIMYRVSPQTHSTTKNKKI